MWLSWRVPILAYHRIGEPTGDHVPTVTPESFEAQLACIARRRVTVLDLDEVIGMMKRCEPIPRRSIVITFDDGYEETASIAAGLLRRFGFRATVFVTPKEVGSPGFMSWEQVRAIANDGLTIGSHTLHHTYLPVVSREQARRELVESKQMLEQQLGRSIDWLSYPVGGFTPEIQALVRAAGYRAALTTNRGVSKRSDDLFAIRRIKVTERDRHPAVFWVKLSGYYDLFRRLEHPA